MKRLFDELSSTICKQTTKKYSTSFSLGILALHNHIRPAIYAIYGFVRLADEIVDSFHEYNQKALLQQFRQQTYQAMEERISLNPIVNAFQKTAHQYAIAPHLIDSFLESMEMDLEKIAYDKALYQKYIYGSAEVVGLMCLQVFVQGHTETYEQLKPYARLLGSAFQKVNFLRDIQADYQVLGRTYFPHVNFNQFNETTKQHIEQEIEMEFKEALKGIHMLPTTSRFGVLLAFKYYQSLFYKIKRIPAKRIMQERIRVANGKKLWLMLSSYVECKMAV